MANTYSQLYAHLIFSPLGRQNLLVPSLKEPLYKYISGIIANKRQKLFIINVMPDHVHILLGFQPDLSISDLMRDIKANSTGFINRINNYHFSWQKGFGAFTYHKSMIPTIVNYIKEQEKHHRKKTFREEYIALLKKAGIEYDEKYLFEWYD